VGTLLKRSTNGLAANYGLVELLHSHITTQSYCSSGSTVCFPPTGAAVHIPGVHPNFWNWDLLLVMSRYISDLNMILDHRPR
jgi:hypothetical protein